jgi:transcription elongation factor GreB
MNLVAEQQKNYITPSGFQGLKDEYAQLMNVERPRIVETVAWAASNGDRSENADYHYGKKRLREIDSRLRFLLGRLEGAEIVDPSTLKSADKVLFGATVTILNEDDEELIYQIVGEDEFDVKSGKISWKSPLAKALLGKKLDDEVSVKKPNGEEIVTIIKIQFI